MNYQSNPAVLQNILASNAGVVSDGQIEMFQSAGWHLWNNDGFGYTDFEYCKMYQTRAENGHADYSLNVHLTIDWEGGEVYLMLGDNFGDGFNDEHYVGNDGSPFNEQMERCIKAIRETAANDPYLALIDSNPQAWADLVAAAERLGKVVGVPNPLQRYVA